MAKRKREGGKECVGASRNWSVDSKASSSSSTIKIFPSSYLELAWWIREIRWTIGFMGILRVVD